MGAEFDLADEDASAIFSAPRIRSRLAQGASPVVAFRETLKWGRERLYSLFHEGTAADALVPAPTWWTRCCAPPGRSSCPS